MSVVREGQHRRRPNVSETASAGNPDTEPKMITIPGGTRKGLREVFAEASKNGSLGTRVCLE
jgi:hypothetical protein